MALEIEPVSAVYDDARDVVRFTGLDGACRVRCSVSRQALRTLVRRRVQSSAMGMSEAYRSHASQIHQIAMRKYESSLLDTDGSVLVLQRDFRSTDAS